ncbi:hypothetical protein HPO96_19770 [Kribbella sandramycini]|uniref:Uncharacterized protein n=1 Tax=Kribbella sandramycini TaxID=60450 RepID=A0A7Y4L1A5_9ACTN|nr:hypothetical protein [Kribbella sandramycini]MBB6564789.1 hypothetical protein [Kribbella sandramycini]NOL42488.1 hypothetical protein [Kribbella sandramycini]
MNWQLWVVIGVLTAAFLVYLLTRMRHAQHVFDDITRIDRPPAPADELATRRAGRLQPEPGRRRKHG